MEFDRFFADAHGATPARLLKAKIYRTIATPLKGGAWREVSLVLLLRALAAELPPRAAAEGTAGAAASESTAGAADAERGEVRGVDWMGAIGRCSRPGREPPSWGAHHPPGGLATPSRGTRAGPQPPEGRARPKSAPAVPHDVSRVIAFGGPPPAAPPPVELTTLAPPEVRGRHVIGTRGS